MSRKPQSRMFIILIALVAVMATPLSVLAAPPAPATPPTVSTLTSIFAKDPTNICDGGIDRSTGTLTIVACVDEDGLVTIEGMSGSDLDNLLSGLVPTNFGSISHFQPAVMRRIASSGQRYVSFTAADDQIDMIQDDLPLLTLYGAGALDIWVKGEKTGDFRAKSADLFVSAVDLANFLGVRRLEFAVVTYNQPADQPIMFAETEQAATSQPAAPERMGARIDLKGARTEYPVEFAARIAADFGLRERCVFDAAKWQRDFGEGGWALGEIVEIPSTCRPAAFEGTLLGE